jgi:hypothetical protein
MSIFSTRILLATDGSGEAELAASNGEGGPRPHRSAKSRVTHRQQQRAWADSRSWEAGAASRARFSARSWSSAGNERNDMSEAFPSETLPKRALSSGSPSIHRELYRDATRNLLGFGSRACP